MKLKKESKNVWKTTGTISFNLIKGRELEVVLGIDLGTSYFKAVIMNREGTLLGLGRTAVPVAERGGSSWEVPADSFLKALKTTIDEACEAGGTAPGDICAVSYASQANSFLLLDRNNIPLTPLVLWPDTRGLEDDPALEELWSSLEYMEKTGMSFTGRGFAISKIRWFQKTRPSLWAETRRIMTISDYLSFILTGEHVGDAGTASLLGIYNLREMRWWSEALSSLGIPEEFLSVPLRPGSFMGYTASSASEYLGLRSGIPCSSGGLDHHVAAIGAGAGRIAEISESTGTVLAVYHSPVTYNPDLTSCLGPSVKEEEYYRLRFSNNGARGIEWYRNTFAKEYSLSELNKLAAAVPAGSEGLIALPEVFEEKDFSRFIKGKNHYTHGHYVRAIMESTSVSLLDLLAEIFAAKEDVTILATGGGAQSNLWLDIKAALTGTSFVTTKNPEPAAFGAGMLAALAAGWFDNLDDISRQWISVKEVHYPDDRLSREYGEWLKRYRRGLEDFQK